MGKMQNVFLKRKVKRDKTFTYEQKDVLFEAIDKHGYNGLRFLVDEVNRLKVEPGNISGEYKYNAENMKEVLKYMDRVDPTTRAYTSALSKVGVLFVATVYNQLLDNEIFANGENRRAHSTLDNYERLLFKTYFKIVSAVEKNNTINDSKSLFKTLMNVKIMLVNPYLACSGRFSTAALHEIQFACDIYANPLRLLDKRYTPEQIKLISHAMLNRASEETLDKMCNPDLSIEEMTNILHGVTEAQVPEFKLNELVVDDRGRRARVLAYEPEINQYHVLFVDFDSENIGAGGWYSPEQLKPYKAPEKATNEQQDLDSFVVTNIGKVPIEDYREIVANQHGFDSYEEMYREGFRIGNGYDKEPEPVVPACEQKKERSQNLQKPQIDDLIASADAISAQTKELSQNLQKLKDSVELVH